MSGPADVFPNTDWSLVLRVGGDQTLIARKALENVLRTYCGPMRRHLMRRGHPAADADDLLQEFIAERILEKGLIARADRQRGRFRNFLLTSLDHFAATAYERRSARKRAPEKLPVSLEHAEAATATSPRSGDTFDLEWARQVLDEATERMRAYCRQTGRDAVWAAFEARIRKPALESGEPPSYEQVAADLALESALQAANLTVSAKRIFQRMLRRVIQDYAADEAMVEDELRDLAEVLSRATPHE